MICGYGRVSTHEQNIESQIELLKQHGAERIFYDKESGTNDNRPEFLRMREFIRPGDTLIVTELSRVGRRLLSVLEFVQEMKDNNINFISLRENIDLSSPSGNLILQIMASIAEFERNRLLERQRVGIEYAKANGVKFGRPTADRKKVDTAVKLYYSKSMSVKEICETTGVSRSVLYRAVNENKQK